MIININEGQLMNSTPHQDQLRTWENVLHREGLRITDARQTVMEILVESTTALTAQEIYDRAREQGHAVGIASVYRTLEMLTELDLVQQIHQPQGCQAYGPALSGHKHFVICTDCGRLFSFAGHEALEDLFKEVEKKSGYRVQEHWLQLFGLCEACQV